jgi:ssDNA-binding Zn-finger/Zn-ribbon topoisomerase 1
MADSTAVPICPKCGAAMVLRNRKSDGAPFWGCSGFPTCRGIRQAVDSSPLATTTTGPIERTPTDPIESMPIDEPAQEARPMVSDAVVSDAGASARAEFNRRAKANRTVRRKAAPYILALGAAGIGFCVLMSQVGPVPAGPIGPTFRMLWLFAICPILATVIGALVLPSHTTAWRTGAEGEEAIGRVLARLEPEGFRAIHDRRIPSSVRMRPRDSGLRVPGGKTIGTEKARPHA